MHISRRALMAMTAAAAANFTRVDPHSQTAQHARDGLHGEEYLLAVSRIAQAHHQPVAEQGVVASALNVYQFF